MKIRMLALLLMLLILCGCMDSTGTVNGETTVNTQANPGSPENTGVSCHSDKEDDGICDACGENLLVTVDFYCFNDLHGKFSDGENHPGVDEMTTYLKNAMETDEHVILLSAGDTWQGSAESNMTQGLIMTDWMNELGFAAMALGNHEFDWGEDAVRANAEQAQFPLLAINIYDRETDSLVDYCDSSVMVDLGQVQIGIIGAIGDCYSSIASDKTQGIYFKVGSELTELVMDESELLREQGADFIVYLLHDGYGDSSGTGASQLTSGQLASYYDTDLSDGYVDLVFEGHTHQQYLAEDKYAVPHLQNRGDNKGGISHVEMSYNTVTGSTRLTRTELVLHSAYTSLESDPIVEDLLEKYDDLIAPANEVVGNNAALRYSHDLRQKVADLYFELGLQTWGDEYDIILGGGFISVRSPYELPAGEVVYAQLQSLFPFDNDLVLCSVRGSDLLAKFINTDNRNYYICLDDELTAADIDPDGTYYIVVDTYTSSYGPNRLTVVEEYERGIYARDLLADFIAAGGYE